MKGYINTKIGEVAIDDELVANYAGAAAMECFGVVGMAAVSMRDGLAKLLRRDNLKKGVDVKIDDNEITVSLHVIVAYGVSIQAVADNLISNVQYRVENGTGMKVKKINVFVEGVRVVD